MHGPSHPSPFLIGEWTILPARREIARRGEVRVLEPRHVDVLCYMASRQGEVVPTEDLLDACWGGGFFGDNPVHKTVAMLRRALGDDARQPRYIATIRKRGYVLVAPLRGTRPVEDRLENAIRRWGHSASFQRRMRTLTPDDEQGWRVLTSVLLRIASSLVHEGALPQALGTVDVARGWLAAHATLND